MELIGTADTPAFHVSDEHAARQSGIKGGTGNPIEREGLKHVLLALLSAAALAEDTPSPEVSVDDVDRRILVALRSEHPKRLSQQRIATCSDRLGDRVLQLVSMGYMIRCVPLQYLRPNEANYFASHPC